MYDKVKILIDGYTVGQDGFNQVSGLLSGAKEQTNLTTGETRLFGSLSNMHVSMSKEFIMVEGSLSKFLWGDNVHNLTRNYTKEALQKLADVLHIDITDATVLGLEFAANIIMKHPVSQYLELLGALPRMNRVQCSATSLYYKQSAKKPTRLINIYDKNAEAKAKGMPIPEDFEDANILRFELRLLGKVARQMGLPEVTTARLYDRTFYNMLTERCQGYYFSIKKQHYNKDFMEQLHTPKDMEKGLYALGLNVLGQDGIERYYQTLKDANKIKTRQDLYRLKKRVQETMSKGACANTDALITELDDDFKNLSAYI